MFFREDYKQETKNFVDRTIPRRRQKVERVNGRIDHAAIRQALHATSATEAANVSQDNV